MIKIPQIPFRRRRKPVAGSTVLALASAAHDSGTNSVTLTFNQAVDLTGIQPNEIIVSDGNQNLLLGGQGVLEETPTSVRLELEFIDYTTEPNVMLNATNATGIRSQADESEWEGVSGVELPYGG